MGGSHKGSSYEREICKQLSLWWSGGKRDDIFWRSSQSGGRATQRAKSGKSTFGSYGDIAAVDPIGQSLLKLVTIELKRGRSHGCPNDLLDCKPSKKPKPFEQALQQAMDAGRRAGTNWLLVCRRDGRISMVYFPAIVRGFLPRACVGRVSRFCVQLSNGEDFTFFAMPFDEFLTQIGIGLHTTPSE